MSLADQIIEHGPWGADSLVPMPLGSRFLDADELNELRDELIAARKLRDAPGGRAIHGRTRRRSHRRGQHVAHL